MKKIFALILSILLFIFTLAGCTYKADFPEAPLPVTEEEKTEVIKPDYDLLYEPVLKQYVAFMHEVLEGNDQYDELGDDEIGLREATFGLGYEAFDTIGYLIKDISGDDVPELLVGISDKNEGAYTKNDILAIYTISDNEPFFILGGRSRSSYSLMEGNSLFYYGSSGAAYSAFGELVLYENGKDVVYRDFYHTDINENFEVLLYHNTNGTWESSESSLLDITEEEFWAKSEALAQKTVSLDFKPLSSVPGIEIRVSINVDFASEEDFGKYTVFTADESEAQTGVIFRSNTDAGNFKLLGLSYEGNDEAGEIAFSEEVLFELEALEKENPLIVKMTFFGTIPSYGISYTDSDGTEKRFAIVMSGVDGSLMLSEM